MPVEAVAGGDEASKVSFVIFFEAFGIEVVSGPALDALTVMCGCMNRVVRDWATVEGFVFAASCRKFEVRTSHSRSAVQADHGHGTEGRRRREQERKREYERERDEEEALPVEQHASSIPRSLTHSTYPTPCHEIIPVHLPLK